ncbi:MAG: MFS transporter [Deltaproteobacteria bacterium]|nr:MFS transporter [Deltaproteobacteria bacterium]
MSQTMTLSSDKVNQTQLKVLLVTFSAYLTTYFAKYNISASTQAIQDQFSYTNAEFGAVLTAFAMVYGFGQFLAGYLSNRFSSKTVLLIGIFGSVAANILFGLSSSLALFAVFWCLNALSLSMVWSPITGVMYSWLPEKKWGSWMGILCALSYVGSALAMPVASFIAASWGWRATFIGLPLIFGFSGLLIFLMVKATPEKAGFKADWMAAEKKSTRISIKEYLLCLANSKFLMLCLCMILANAVRWGLNNWIIKILSQPAEDGGYGFSLVLAGAVGSSIHWGAAFLSLTTGWLSDKAFAGRRWPVICLAFAISGVSLSLLSSGAAILAWTAGLALLVVLLFLTGGLIQAMMAPMSCLPGDLLGSDRGAAGNGLLYGTAYIGAMFSGSALGAIMDAGGNMAGILTLAGFCGVGAILSFAIRR